MRKEKIVVLAYFGDGGTSKGDFHEALNFAGVFKTPNVFICQNNQYAISVPRARQSASETLAQKAFAYGFGGVLVDGNDAFAVFDATKKAVEKARSGNGPTLIECFTYRMGDHTTADDAARYRNKQELEEWAKRDPIDRLRKFMQKKGLWSESYEKQVLEQAQKKVEEAIRVAESVEPEGPEGVFNYMYKELTPRLKDQLRQLKEEGV